ncbi:MAG: D-alanyl-D-alanine carboxypeptidase family protein [Actinomycetota bacterium]
MSFSRSVLRRRFAGFSPSLLPPALAASLLAVLLLLGAPGPSDADLKEDIEQLKEEREQLKRERESKARAIDAATAEANEVAEALGVLNAAVNEQEEALLQAEVLLREAETRFAEASGAVATKTAEIDQLKDQVTERAVSAFVGQNVGSTPVLENTNPNQAVRMKSLVQSVTRQEVDVTERLREAKEDLDREQARADQAAQEADRFRAEIAAELDQLQEVRDRQAELANAAEARLEAQLAEAAVMAERDKAIAADIAENEEELQRQIELARRRNPAPTSTGNTKFPTADEITNVGGFWVHVEIAEDVRQLLAAAEADGITFGGWGYRDHSAQIRLRRAHCGTSNYAIYQMPSSQCRPPTARPGASQHELGKAIDFTYNGRTIGTRSSPGYQWLAANAADYGLYNLPSEPWHWSVNGR